MANVASEADKRPIGRVAFCPHCGNRAPQRLIHVQRFFEQTYTANGDLTDVDASPISAYYVAFCETCGEILLYYLTSSTSDKDFYLADLVYPDSGVLHKAVPKAIADCYSEAARIKNVAPNAFAVQIRRALEMLCDDRVAKKGGLQRRLAELASRDEFPSTLAQMTHVLRLLGNVGAHAASQSVKPGHVGAIDNFFRAIVEYVYVAPSKLKEFRDELGGLGITQESSDTG